MCVGLLADPMRTGFPFVRTGGSNAPGEEEVSLGPDKEGRRKKRHDHYVSMEGPPSKKPRGDSFVDVELLMLILLLLPFSLLLSWMRTTFYLLLACCLSLLYLIRSGVQRTVLNSCL
jgi:hypothetical protein